MSKIKIITPDAYDFGMEQFSLVKLARNGLTGADRQNFEKRAASSLLSDIPFLREKVAADEALAHLLAVGATEYYSANRNGDGFRQKVCREYHPTFVKFAKFYRNHKNKDPSISYGRVVKSAYNEPMQRIELLVALNTNEEAARRNNGFVADKELEKLASGRDLPVSMACHVDNDVCSYCGNVARTTRDYCVGTMYGGHCKAGGLRDHIGSLVDIDGALHQLHADNPRPQFFDISHVPRGADRIAYITGLLEKSAADRGGVVKSAEIAEQLHMRIPAVLLCPAFASRTTHELVKLAQQLAEQAATFTPTDVPTAYRYACHHEWCDDVEIPANFQKEAQVYFRAFADAGILLPLAPFVAFATNMPMDKAAEVAEVIRCELPGAYDRLLEDPMLANRLEQSVYRPAPAASGYHRACAEKLAQNFAITPREIEKRAIRASLNNLSLPAFRTPVVNRTKTAADSAGVTLADEYALYKLATLHALQARVPDFATVVNFSLTQDCVA